MEARIVAHLERHEHDEAISLGLRAYGPELLGYLARVVADPDLAQEIFCDASEKMWRGIADFRAESSFRVWAYRVAWNAAADQLRRRARRREHPLRTREVEELVAEVRLATAPLDRTSVRDGLEMLRRRLAPDEQTLLILRLDRGLTWREVAAVLGDADEVAVRKRFERVKKRIRQLAEREGILTSRGPSR